MDDARPFSVVSLQPTADPLQLFNLLQPADPLQLSHLLQPAFALNQQDAGVKSKFANTTNPEANEENTILCKDCGKMYADEAKLKKHVYIYHTNHTRNFKCDWPTCARGEYFFQK